MPSTLTSIILPSIKLAVNENMSLDYDNEVESGKHPRDILNLYANQWQIQFNNENFAKKLDEIDPLNYTRDDFYYPQLNKLPKVNKSRLVNPEGDCIYLCGHSLGLQSKRVRKAIGVWLEDWANLGVYGHVYGSNPFAFCDYPCLAAMNRLVGAEEKEVGVMNQLTTNLHFLMISFYRPTKDRYKILYEKGAFPSDEYAVRSQLEFHGYDSTEGSIVVQPRPNENILHTEDIIRIIEEHGSSIALVLLSGIQYYTGQLFDIPTITRVAQEQGCVVGWDLAHAVGNVPLRLHDWNVDFAVWCTYKYLNASAGCVGGLFVHKKHFDGNYPHFDGWWGNRDESRFKMSPQIDRGIGADGFRISNPSIHQCATLKASLEIFDEVGIDKLRKKSKLLTQYLYDLIEEEINQSGGRFKIEIITPSEPEQRGAQLSLRFLGIEPNKVFNELQELGACLDLRGDIIRIAPMPLYNRFMDIFSFVNMLKTLNTCNENK